MTRIDEEIPNWPPHCRHSTHPPTRLNLHPPPAMPPPCSMTRIVEEISKLATTLPPTPTQTFNLHFPNPHLLPIA